MEKLRIRNVTILTLFLMLFVASIAIAESRSYTDPVSNVTVVGSTRQVKDTEMSLRRGYGLSMSWYGPSIQSMIAHIRGYNSDLGWHMVGELQASCSNCTGVGEVSTSYCGWNPDQGQTDCPSPAYATTWSWFYDTVDLRGTPSTQKSIYTSTDGAHSSYACWATAGC